MKTDDLRNAPIEADSSSGCLVDTGKGGVNKRNSTADFHMQYTMYCILWHHQSPLFQKLTLNRKP
jgi:hypothetical protein